MDASESHAESPSGDTFEHKAAAENDADLPLKKPGSKAQGRKRTKTGCLTCRKRRIKCGEERPVCQNCTKSKRQCEGYNQRVVFKDPLSAYQPSLSTSSQMSFLRSISSPSTVRQRESISRTTSWQKTTPIAPKPPGTSIPPSDTFGSSSMSLPAVTPPGIDRKVRNIPEAMPSRRSQTLAPVEGRGIKSQVDIKTQSQKATSRKKSVSAGQSAHYDFDALTQANDKKPPSSPEIVNHLAWSDGSRRESKPSPPNTIHESPRRPSAPACFYQSSAKSTWDTSSGSTISSSSSGPPNLDVPTLQSSSDSAGSSKEDFQSTSSRENNQICSEESSLLGSRPPRGEWNISQPWPLDQYQLDSIEEDSDPFDVSEEDVEMAEVIDSGVWQEVTQDDHLKNNDLGIVVALQASQDHHGTNLRSFTTFIDRPDMLATYIPSSQSTPLRDPMTARIFCHFVNVTGPCISMFERHPANPSLIFQGEPVPKTQQHIWTYTFPTLALQNPALLHAMLAIASLHIAKLQNGSITASYKHYALSLRGVAKSVSLQSRRGHPATLAAALLLAFYECWSADHQKWSNHLLGARQLVREIDFAQMTRYTKRRTAENRQQYNQIGLYFDDTHFQPQVDDVDENIVGILMGNKVCYDQYGHVMDEDTPAIDDEKEYTERDLEIYETQRDLFWWYCKQDTYQSILGGGPLFMDYSLWSHCPPRAPLGRLNALYGTFDHLILLMGRLANFAAKDLKRKRLAIKMNGGCWQPSKSTRMPPQVNKSTPTRGSLQTPIAPPIPSFSGMVPDVKEATLPMGFEPPSGGSSPQSSTQCDDIDLQAQTWEAEEEWEDVRSAFTVLQDHFGEEFQPLGPEFSAPIRTPFGPALQYRTVSIAGVWMNHYMALIACHRAHPSMPPAAMMAAGISAQQTAFFANELGRIAAGIAPDCSMTAQVNPSIGAALIESCQPLFISGVQYQNAEQRSWTVCRLRDIARLTGWQSALAIAAGCETTWAKTGELGKGPPYTRTKEERIMLDIWSSSRRIDRAFDGKTNEERRLVVERSDRVHYAMGVLSLEEDFEKLDLDKSVER